jgi:hypothetical protein
MCTLGLTTIITMYISEQPRKMHNEGENFMHKICSVLEMFTNKVHIQNPDSNLAALDHACEYLQPILTNLQ